jgi:alanine-glyoxylate transaminase/serine-glyoxylate transaminase/serine-pyruvate transaminase
MAHDPLPVSEVPVVPPRILLGPGPSDANPRVLQAMSGPMIGYLDPDFVKIMEEVSGLLRRVFNTEESLTMVLSGTGSAGMEAGLSSLLEPGDTVILCVCGFFGRRMADMAQRVGANVVLLQSEWGRPFPPEMLEAELKKHDKVKMVATVHAETSTGVLQPLEEISRLTKEHGALLMVDAVTSLGGTEVRVDDIGIDYCYSATQKCLAAPPGLSPVAMSPRAIEVVANRDTKPTSWYLDLALISNYWGGDHVYHHTAPVSNIVGLREGLRVILEEGMGPRIARHNRNSAALRAGLEALGLQLVVSPENRLDQITPVWIPEGINDQAVRASLLRDYHIEIGRGLGDFAGKVWRVGLMGDSSKSEYVLALLSALESILPSAGYEVAVGSGVGAASKSLAAS